MKKFENKIFNADCLDILKKMPSCSVEAIITDIPYALTATTRPRPDQNKNGSYGKQVPFSRQQSRGGFMNLDWDSDIPSLKIFKELLRVIKYGGFFVTTFTTRMDRQLQLYQRLKESGWDISYSPLYWGYKTGFPKAANFSKLADKKLGRKREITGQDKCFGRQDSGIYGFNTTGKNKTEFNKKDKPSSKEAQMLDGWFSYNLKPAIEIIVCARKPSPEKSLIGNALESTTDKKYAVGGMFVGGTEIPFEEQDYKDYVKKQKSFSGAKSIGKTKKGKTTFLSGDIKTLDPSKKFKGYGTKIPYENEKDAKHQDDIARGQASSNGGKFFGGKGKSLSSRYGTKIPYKNNEDRDGAIFGTQTEISGGGYGTKRPSDGNVFKKNVLSSDYGRFPANLILSGDFPEHIKKYFNLDLWAEKVIGDFIFISKPSTREKNSNVEGKEVLNGTGSNTYNKKCLKCGCYDDKTEILTKKGFIFFKDLKSSDEVATLENNYLKYIHPVKIFQYKYHGKMINFYGQNIDLVVTPNHNMYVRQRTNKNKILKFKEFKFIEAQNIKRGYKIKRNLKWKGKNKKIFRLPSIKITKWVYGKYKISKKLEDIKIDYKDWLEFFGLWLADGYSMASLRLNRKTKNCTVGVTQTKLHTRPKVESILNKLPFHYHYASGKNYVISRKQLFEYLKQFGKTKTKFIPESIKNLAPDLLHKLLDGFILGDGHIRKDGRMEIWTSNFILANDLQEIALKCGYVSSVSHRITKWKVNGIVKRGIIYRIPLLKNQQETKIQHIKEREYNGNIYCCEVPSHIILVRRNGKVAWCGNSWQRHHKGEYAEHHKKYTCTCEEPEWEEPSGNFAPTVKPISLFCYLITMFTRENSLVLEPFMGSGTAVMACRLMNRKYIGIEKEKGYFDIARQRIWGKIVRQQTLF